jgi:transcriptional regulator GlxA family with amidase domain
MQVATTPARWIAEARVRKVQKLLETTNLGVEQLASESGFRSAAVLREQFEISPAPVRYHTGVRWLAVRALHSLRAKA